MQCNQFRRLSVLVASVATAALMLGGCSGGKDGANGANGKDLASATQVSQLSADQWSGLKLAGEVTSVSINSPPVVNFKVTDANGNPVVGLGNTSKKSTDIVASYPNLSFSLAKLVPADSTTGAPSRWVSYIVTTVPSNAAASSTNSDPTKVKGTRPTTDNTGTLVDNGDGSYKYTFYRDVKQSKDLVANATTYTASEKLADLGDLTYDPTLTHRLTIAVSGNARNTGTNTATGVQALDSNGGAVAAVAMKNPLNLIYDFIPATGKAVASTDAQREVVMTSACLDCHGKFTFHGGGRQDTRYCVVCHTDQRKFGQTEATIAAGAFTSSTNRVYDRAIGNLPDFIHKVHMGEELSRTNYNYANVKFNETTYPQDIRNCVKCHTGVAQADNWKNTPSRAACGSCHDAVDFALGTNHAGGIALNDSGCVTCHPAASIEKAYHLAVISPDPNSSFNGGTNTRTNAAYMTGFTNNLPTGANIITYDVKSVTRNASKQPVITFKLKKNGNDVVFNTSGAKTEIMDGYTGSPSLYFVFAVPQDGITAPADFNASANTYLKKLWNGTAAGTSAGTLSATPDSQGYYTATLTGVTVPDNAVMLTGGVGYTYDLASAQPLTQIDLAAPYDYKANKTGGLIVQAPNVWKVASGGALKNGVYDAATAYTGRRAIVDNAHCNKCHAQLGIKPAFHVGQRNDAPTCVFCHNPNKTNTNGWAVNTKDFVHALHAGSKRVNKFSWEAANGDAYWKVTYPNLLNNCEACHLPGTYDFSASTSSSALSNLLWSTAAVGTMPAAVPAVVTGNEVVPGNYWSAFVTANAVYGSGFSFNAGTQVTTPAAATTLVISPIAAACFSCHDTTDAITHMKQNGAAIYAPRSGFQAGGNLVNQETCLICHGSGKQADIKAVHQ